MNWDLFKNADGVAAFIAVYFLWQHVRMLHSSCEKDRAMLWQVLRENNLTTKNDENSENNPA